MYFIIESLRPYWVTPISLTSLVHLTVTGLFPGFSRPWTKNGHLVYNGVRCLFRVFFRNILQSWSSLETLVGKVGRFPFFYPCRPSRVLNRLCVVVLFFGILVSSLSWVLVLDERTDSGRGHDRVSRWLFQNSSRTSGCKTFILKDFIETYRVDGLLSP